MRHKACLQRFSEENIFTFGVATVMELRKMLEDYKMLLSTNRDLFIICCLSILAIWYSFRNFFPSTSCEATKKPSRDNLKAKSDEYRNNYGPKNAKASNETDEDAVFHAQVSAGGKLPNPDPWWDFDLKTATTRNHIYVNKTVRWPYYQTMAHQPMHINDWIEIDKDYEWYLDEKKRVIREQGKVVVDSLPENDAACGELLEVLVDYLPKRYPTLFEKIENLETGNWGIYNEVTNERFENLEGVQGVKALEVCSKLVQDDFLMALERPDGHVYFTGGLVAFPGFYLLSEKISKSIRETHAPVPYFNTKLALSVERTLKRFKPEEPFERTSWEVVDDRELFWHNVATTHTIPPTMHPKDLYFRMDHQTFRKLPKTGGIIFGVHPIMKRLSDLEDDPLVPALLVKLHEEGDRVLMDYKLAPAYENRALPYLKEMTRRQIEKGLITGDEEVSTFRSLAESGKNHPNRQSSLSEMTESEKVTRGLAQWDADGKVVAVETT